MDERKMTENALENAPIPTLLLQYSVPTALTLMVNYLYNIVDQIFVGHGIGITGMTAINVAFPMMILVNAVALLLGDGCAANISLSLGRRQQQIADATVSHGLSLVIGSGVLCAILCGMFAPQIAVLCGTTETAYGQSVW